MPTYHIHIEGLVQGVGFRPFINRVARQMGLHGWVSNTPDGVHVEFNAAEEEAAKFYQQLHDHPPTLATIQHHTMHPVAHKPYTAFHITTNQTTTTPHLILPPDLALCPQCRQEMQDPNNRRYRYPFTTCLQCGPRSSILRSLPYDRANTTMAAHPMCPQCTAEYNNIDDRRYYSQTNTCPHCAIPMHLREAGGSCLSHNNEEILFLTERALNEGRIVAVKSIGGYLLLCDATNQTAIATLRQRKHRPLKPFALLYANIPMATADVTLRPVETNALQSSTAPIVLCPLKTIPGHDLCTTHIAPGLDKIGLMLPSSPLLQLIADDFNRPLVATSANISSAPIIYTDQDAHTHLSAIADYILSYDRDIVTPQDDTVIAFTESEHPIILRNGRGRAPLFFPVSNHHLLPNSQPDNTILAMGAELKSAFALLTHNSIYVSQYLGHQDELDAQTSYTTTLNHLLQLLNTTPTHILIDLHPDYQVSRMGETLATQHNIPINSIQHHEAHFAAVLAENNLLSATQPILGVIWDGNGYGTDGQVWGGEMCSFQNGQFERIAHLRYFPQLLGNKMNREPRLSALALLQSIPEKQHRMAHAFSPAEWHYFRQQLNQPAPLLTSSMGRLLEGIAAILDITHFNDHEGHAVTRLEALARSASPHITTYYPLPILQNQINWQVLLQSLLFDLEHGVPKNTIARKVLLSLAHAILHLSDHLHIQHIAFSGGVFQNVLLVDLIRSLASPQKQLYFHQHLSPNDECIGYGQLAAFLLHQHTQTQRIAYN